jgi:DNA-binding CsgD family transcriptional regulator
MRVEGSTKKSTKTPHRVVRRVIKKNAILLGMDSGDAPKNNSESLTKKRKMLADLCRLLEQQVTGRSGAVPIVKPTVTQPDPRLAGLAPRLKQTLLRMLTGDSEKQIAMHLGLSPHTIHIYVKSLYRHFKVSSRGELLARFVVMTGDVKSE